MAKLINRAAASLLEQALRNGNLEDIYKGAVDLAAGKNSDKKLPEDLSAFLHYLTEADVQPIMTRFLEMAREELNIMPVEVISAVPLKPEQIALLEIRVIHLVKKRINITNTIDHSIIGGLRIIIGTMVIDNSIKSQLIKMKEELYKGVYFNNEIESS